jgi:hypothetical protein
VFRLFLVGMQVVYDYLLAFPPERSKIRFMRMCHG